MPDISSLNAEPRKVGLKKRDPPFLVFTDGACEKETSIGGVLVVPNLPAEYFGAVITGNLVNKWMTSADQEQVIGQAELFPVLVALHTWRNKLAGKRMIFFIDNDSARQALVKGYSPLLQPLEFVSECYRIACRHNIDVWFTRVPTDANISDGPSRMDDAWVKKFLWCSVVHPVEPHDGCFASVLR